MASPAIRASRPGASDSLNQGGYPIVLGDSLRDLSKKTSRFINVRYNWRPKSGLVSQKSTLTEKDGHFQLAIQDDKSGKSNYLYEGNEAEAAGQPSKDEPIMSLALVFDDSKSAYVLESISASLDLNITSAVNHTERELKAFPRLPQRAEIASSDTSTHVHAGATENEDDTPDPHNPFDFRHFLVEARANSEKASHHLSSRTPIPGGRTPMSGISSPVPGASRFVSNTPQPRPTAPTEPLKKGKVEDPVRKALSTTKPDAARKAPKAPPQSLPKTRVSDSEDETITLSHDTRRTQGSAPGGHNRNASSGGFVGSPHITINDGDLEIDLGSPPPEMNGRRRIKVNPEAFRSHTHTPQLGRSANERRVEDSTRTEDQHDDTEMQEVQVDAADEDEDVEALELGSPRTNKLETREESGPELPSTTTPEEEADAEDDEDLLAAELEAALEEEDNADATDAGGYGLGISGGAGQDEDESEVSEEE